MVSNQRVVPAQPNIYTVLTLIATLALMAGTIFVAVRNVELTKLDQPNEGSNPWFVVDQSDNQKSVTPASGD